MADKREQNASIGGAMPPLNREGLTEASRPVEDAADRLAISMLALAAEKFDPQRYGFVDKSDLPPSSYHPQSTYYPHTDPHRYDASLQRYPYSQKLNIITSAAAARWQNHVAPHDDSLAPFSSERIGRNDFTPHVVVGFYYTPTSEIDPQTYDATKGQHFYTGGRPQMHILIWGGHVDELKNQLGVQRSRDNGIGVYPGTYNAYGLDSRDFTRITLEIDPEQPDATEEKMGQILKAIMPYADGYQQSISGRY